MNVVVLGGGISGLSCAYYLSTLGKNVIKKITLIERSTTLGGWIQTTRFPDGTIYEHGPRSLRPSDVEGLNSLKLVEDLGLSDSVLPVTGQSLSAQRRLILVNNKLYSLPNRLSDILLTRPPFSKPLMFAALKDLFSRKKLIDDESLYSFTCRRFGQEVADYVMDPFCRGIVAGNAKEISIRSLFKHIYAAEQKYGSVIWGQIKDSKVHAVEELYKINSDLGFRSRNERWSMWTFQNGLQCLSEALASYLENHELVSLYTNSACSRITFKNNKSVLTTEEAEIEADHVFACIPSKRLSRLISTQYPNMASTLMSIPAVHVGLVNLEFSGRVLKEEGFGYLVPSNQKSKILGVIFDSCCFPSHDGKYQDKTRMTCIMGGHWFREFFGDVDSVTQDKLLEIAVRSVYEHLGIKEPVSRHSVHILRNCIPQYRVGHHSILDNLLQNITDQKMCLSLLGASYHGVGINDCIFNAKTTVQNFVSSLAKNNSTEVAFKFS